MTKNMKNKLSKMLHRKFRAAGSTHTFILTSFGYQCNCLEKTNECVIGKCPFSALRIVGSLPDGSKQVNYHCGDVQLIN